MKHEGKYLLGTPEEIAEYLTNEIRGETFINANSRFIDYDFAIAEAMEFPILEDIAYNASSWYGIKHIDTGFDSEDFDLFADYYGGGCGVYDCLYDGMEEKRCVEIVKDMILQTLNVANVCTENDILIAEICNFASEGNTVASINIDRDDTDEDLTGEEL